MFEKVSVNEELVHGLYLGNENGEAFRDYQLRIPARFFKGGVNNIDIGATMRAPLAGVPCDDVFGSHLVFQINHSSSIELPEAGNTEIVLIDGLGNQIANIYSGFANQGINEVTYDFSNFTSGVYYYTIKANGVYLTNKLLIVK